MPHYRNVFFSSSVLLVIGLVAAFWWFNRGDSHTPVLPWLAPNVDVYIQAGHENRSSGRTGASSSLGSEQEWTPIVADAAAKALTDAGFNVLRTDANLWRYGRQKAHLALFIHFDGSATACSSGASIGYGAESSADAANHWKRFYSRFWPHTWMRDNFSRNLSGYYGYRYVEASDAELVLELGEITCAKQAKWMKPRLNWLGERVAEFATQRLCHNIEGARRRPPNCPSEAVLSSFSETASDAEPYAPRRLSLAPPGAHF